MPAGRDTWMSRVVLDPICAEERPAREAMKTASQITAPHAFQTYITPATSSPMQGHIRDFGSKTPFGLTVSYTFLQFRAPVRFIELLLRVSVNRHHFTNRAPSPQRILPDA